MPFSLLKMADKHGIIVEYWDFQPPLEAVYWSFPELPPVIGLSNALFEYRAHFRCVLAEELGHHFTTTGMVIPKTFFHYRDRLEVSRAEYRAMRWAALYLMPLDMLRKAFRKGIYERWELADFFDVTEDMVDFRMALPDIRDKLRTMVM
jgi:Zn-dependent peptidase ImmA (M78 family)